LEYKMALAIGAKVCLVGKLGGSAQVVAFDPDWKDLPNLYNIPNDPFTLWAFVNYEKPGSLGKEEVGQLAPRMHEFYRVKRMASFNPAKETDIDKYRVIMEWDKLSPILQKSNINQVAFMEHIFNRGGFMFRKTENPAKILSHDKIAAHDLMARLEHGRWNAERLLNGWSYGHKDVLKKKTPYLVAWDELDDDIKTYDYDPLKNFPGLLAQIGFEVVEIK